MRQSLRRKLEESYEHHIDYAEEDEKLQAMCARCEKWNGKGHDYEGCKMSHVLSVGLDLLI